MDRRQSLPAEDAAGRVRYHSGGAQEPPAGTGVGRAEVGQSSIRVRRGGLSLYMRRTISVWRASRDEHPAVQRTSKSRRIFGHPAQADGIVIRLSNLSQE